MRRQGLPSPGVSPRPRNCASSRRIRALSIVSRAIATAATIVRIASSMSGGTASALSRSPTATAPTERPDIGYAMIFPSATIIKVIAVQVIGLVMLGH